MCLWGPSHSHILPSTGFGRGDTFGDIHVFSARSERATMAVGGIGQMLSLSPENVNNGTASFRIFGFNVSTMFL